ncbi:efflux transporter outer membrane subunit [Variovorax saccharolyticus]|uniref:efflux transporter outer membrane subunit n=1 Tax=Variovorax saccharolyticus TaxID=3053516 RepID=UPI002576C435|nr:efflux transporter outer membrane subunit [Variovorax sp. J22R187]MDM0022821.1 efflux transporter outer membrane subunit [Variovorax sp. J22R187]
MQIFKNGALASAAAIVLVGCSLQPLYQRPAAPVAAFYPTGEGYGTARPASASLPPASETGWRDILTDKRLQQLVEIALRNNRDLRVAVLNVVKVQAQYRIHRSDMFPQLSVYGQGSKSRTPGTLEQSGKPLVVHSATAGLSVAWEVDLFGRLQSLTDAAFEQYMASAHARQAAEILLVSQVASQYLATLSSDERLVVTRDTLDAATNALAIVQRRFEVGTASDLDVSQAQTLVEQAKGNEAEQLRLKAQALNALVLLIGEPMPLTLAPSTPLSEQAIRDDVPAGLPSDLLTRRPDILEAEALLRAENADIGAARAAFFPRIALTGSFGLASSTLGGLFDGGSGAWAFVPSLAAPIFDAGSNRANLDVAKVSKDVGIAQYEKAIQTAFREVADGLAARVTFNDQLVAALRLADAQSRRVRIAQVRFETGLDGYLNVLTAQTDLYNAQLALVSVRLSRLESLVDLYRSLGGGWVQDTGEMRAVASELR